jgi:leader peptidase (prepilin peptidase) / N-methyltransferase
LTLDDFPLWFLRAFAIALGLVWGSFLNVVIYRTPRGMSVVRPASHCPGCGAPIRAWDNVPVFGYLLLGGRARCCKAKLSVRYPIVEAIGGVLSLAIVEVIIFRMPGSTSIGRALAIYVADLALALALVAAAFIDLEHLYVPDTVTYGGAVLGVATCSFRAISFTDALIGAAAGFLVVWLPFDVLYKVIRGRVGMAMGDAKLVMLAGAWFGWSGALFVLGAGAVQGTIVALGTLLVRGKIEEPEAVRLEREEIRAELAAMSPEEREQAEKELAEDPLFADEPAEGVGQSRMAFGPFLVLATLECLIFGRDLSGLYLQWIDV